MLRRVENHIERFEDESTANAVVAAHCFEAATVFAQSIGRVLSKAEMEAAMAMAAGEASTAGVIAEEEKDEEDRDDGGEEAHGATTIAKLLYPSFALHCPWRKVSQMMLHAETKRVLKSDFNVQLESLLSTKRAELEKVRQQSLLGSRPQPHLNPTPNLTII